jgi:UBX domain-containing protein 1
LLCISDVMQDCVFVEFSGLTEPKNQARQYLTANKWDLPAALTEFYTAQEEAGAEHEQDDIQPSDEEDEEEEENEPPATRAFPSGGRRLGDGPSDPQPIPTSASSRASPPGKKPGPQKKFATLGDFNSDSQAHGDGDGDDDDGKQDLFAGGEKSGLAVQNPDDIKKKIIEKAMKGKPVDREEPKQRPSYFTGAARTLGGDDTPSQVIEPPAVPQSPRRAQRVDRVLHFWNNGFSVDDGDLYSTDDPRNAEILNGIRQGRAPLSIMNVMPGQEVDVEIKQHQEDYVRPKKKYVPFAGQGNRLGSPTPGAPSMPGSFTNTTTSRPPSTTNEPPKIDLDESQPTITLQIRLGSGTRLPARFNPTHTIGDVYSFVAAASPESQNREWVLQTTFPTTELTDHTKALGDMPDFKRGGVVVQRWK